MQRDALHIEVLFWINSWLIILLALQYCQNKALLRYIFGSVYNSNATVKDHMKT